MGLRRKTAFLFLLLAGAAAPAGADGGADFPEITVQVLEDPAPGYLFLSNFSFTDIRENVPFLMVLDNSGYPVLQQELEVPINLDFIRQEDGRLSYCNMLEYILLDSTLAAVDTIDAADGYNVDGHEMRILPSGNVLMLTWTMRTADMTAYGGHPNARLQDMAIQEIDPEGNLVWTWKTAEHFDVTDATPDIPLTGMYIDWVHCNAVDVDTDGNVLLSSRHLDEITKIDRQTGEILWRLGGKECKNNQFTFADDTVLDGGDTLFYGFSHQHGVRRLENGHLILFDNGNLKDPPFSRVVEYDLDEENLVARKVWEYRHDPEVFSSEMGFAQRLANGNTFIGWGGNEDGPAVTEVRPDKTVLYEMSLPYDIVSYRAFRFVHLMAAVTRPLEAPGFYGFSEEGNETGVRLEVAESSVPDTVTVQRHRYGAHAVLFAEGVTAPDDTLERRWVVTRTGASDLSASIRFDLAILPEITTPDAAAAYYRPHEGSGEFEPLSIEYEVNAQELVADFAGEGEYILGSFVPVGVESIPAALALGQNVPNPFNGSTVIRFHVSSSGEALLKVYNALGRDVVTLLDGFVDQGSHEIVFDGGDLGSGVYFYKLSFDKYEETKKMVLVR